jgi:RNA polymerase sigma-70 factor (ECF subfamily)
VEFFAFDGAYLERLRSGDFRTEQHFVSYFSQLIHLKLRSRLHSPEAIEDLRQEIFVRVFATLRSSEALRQPDRLGAFVNSVCNNVLLEHYRSSSRTTSVDDGNELLDVPDLRSNVLRAMMAEQTATSVQATLEGLGERDRRLLKDVFLEERDKDEVCREFGVDRDYLRVLLHRAKQTFRSQFEPTRPERRTKIATRTRG